MSNTKSVTYPKTGRGRLAGRLEDHTLRLAPATTGFLYEGRTSSVLKDFPHTFAGLGTAFEVAHSTNLGSNSHTLLWSDRSLARLAQLVNDAGIVAQVLLATNENDRQVLAKVQHFRDPLLLYVVQTVRRVDSKANKDDVRVRVRQRAQPVVVLLTCGIPKCELYVAAVDLDIGHVVLEHSRHVDLGESSLALV